MRIWSAILKIGRFFSHCVSKCWSFGKACSVRLPTDYKRRSCAPVSILRALPAKQLKPPKVDKSLFSMSHRMETDSINDWKLTTTINVVNIVVVGKAGNGKSATDNSILGREAFFSNLSPSGVTCTSELHKTILNDGRIVNVIDTPGLFDFSTGVEIIKGEIVKCIDLAKNGIHAVLMVFSIGSRFTREEEAAVESMKSLFGDKIAEEKQKLSITCLGKQLAKEQAARLEAERFVGESQKELYEIQKLREELNEARRRYKEFRSFDTIYQKCAIL